MYKDKEKQRQADRERQKRRRDKIKVKGVTKPGVTDKVTPKLDRNYLLSGSQIGRERLPANFGQPDCQCRHCQNSRVARPHRGHWSLNHGHTRQPEELADNELNRVAMPGDIDYVGSPEVMKIQEYPCA